MNPHQLQRLIEAAGIPVHGVSPKKTGGWRVDYKEEATQAQRDQGDVIAAGFAPTQAEQEAFDQSLRRGQAKAMLRAKTPEGLLGRAVIAALSPSLSLAQILKVIEDKIDNAED